MIRKAYRFPLTQEQKTDLVQFFHRCYFDTDQDVDVFSSEFYFVISNVLCGQIPVEMDFLTDFLDDLLQIIPDLYETGEELSINDNVDTIIGPDVPF